MGGVDIVITNSYRPTWTRRALASIRQYYPHNRVIVVDDACIDCADELAAMFRSALAGKRVLLVLDNAASTEQVRPLLPGTSGCLVLVTSRHRLSGLAARHGARRITLGTLDPNSAVTLLTGRIGLELTRREPGACWDLARLCGFLPLALRIGAERAKAESASLEDADLVILNT